MLNGLNEQKDGKREDVRSICVCCHPVGQQQKRDKIQSTNHSLVYNGVRSLMTNSVKDGRRYVRGAQFHAIKSV